MRGTKQAFILMYEMKPEVGISLQALYDFRCTGSQNKLRLTQAMAKHMREILWLLYFTETEAASVADTFIQCMFWKEFKLWRLKKKNIFNSQHCSLWVEWIHGVDLIEDRAGVHKDLPDMIVVSPANLSK